MSSADSKSTAAFLSDVSKLNKDIDDCKNEIKKHTDGWDKSHDAPRREKIEKISAEVKDWNPYRLLIYIFLILCRYTPMTAIFQPIDGTKKNGNRRKLRGSSAKS